MVFGNKPDIVPEKLGFPEPPTDEAPDIDELVAHKNPVDEIVPNPSESMIPFNVAVGDALPLRTIGVDLLGVLKLLWGPTVSPSEFLANVHT